MAAHVGRFQQAEINLILDHPGGLRGAWSRLTMPR